MNKLYVKPVKDLIGKSFYIPAYQRGYRWTSQQVTDLLDDINQFSPQNEQDFYCLQPLVVKERISDEIKQSVIEELSEIASSKRDFFEEAHSLLNNYVEWEVIDGQQRLTTIFLILKYLNVNKIYNLRYETRENKSCTTASIGGSSTEDFLNQIGDESSKAESRKNIDFHHFYKAYKTIIAWFKEQKDVDEKTYKDKLMQYVKFIWYQSDGENAIKVFTRLNVGKISLTNAELIKALLLNSSNFSNTDKESFTIEQTRIASEWDKIEYALQNDDFWLFIHPLGYERPTRIDFIFDIIYEEDSLGISHDKCGNDDYRTFRYFYKYFERTKNTSCWNQVKNIFRIINEWYNDAELYHYIGYLIECRCRNANEIYKLWCISRDKMAFLKTIKNDIIKPHVHGLFDTSKGLENSVYEVENGCGAKTKCKDILLLHNIQTIISQNKEITHDAKFQQGVFYKFPFHLYKKERWDIEHIDSNTENPMNNPQDQKAWMSYALIGLSEEEHLELRKEVQSFLKNKNKDIDQQQFDNLRKKILEIPNIKSDWKDHENDKNKIWNFVLLDSSTNRGYGNAIFPAKRRIIMGKDRGIRYSVEAETLTIHPTPDEEMEMKTLLNADHSLKEEDAKKLKNLKDMYLSVAFIPPCTRNVFMKYYVPQPNSLIAWGEKDANAYLNNILVLLKEFL